MAQAQYELNIRDYLRIFRKRKLIFFASILLFTLLGFWYTSQQTPLYEAYTTVKMDERRTVAGLLAEWIAYNPGDLLESETKIIKGFPVLKAAALALGMISDDSTEEQIHEAVKNISEKVTTEQIGNTNILKITVISDKPKEAMELANTVARVYVEHNLSEKNKQARTVREFIERQLNDLESRMKLSEDELRVFTDRIKNIQVAEPIQRKLTELEFELASLTQKYTPKHPRIIQLKEQIADLQNQIAGLSGEDVEYARLQREVEVDRRLYAMLKEKLEQARITEAEKVADVSIVDPATLPLAPVNSLGGLGLMLGAFIGVVAGAIMAFIVESADTSIGTVEDVETITKLPILGVIPSAIEDIRNHSTIFERIRDVIFHKGLSEEQENYIRLIVHHKPMSPTSEAFRNIRTNLKLSSTNKTFLVTSSNPKEGKTTVVTNLGLAIGQKSLRTLLVSSDLRRAQISKAFGIERQPGLAEILQGIIPVEEGMRNVNDMLLGGLNIDDVASSGLRNIWIIPSGAYPPNAAELLASKELPLMINKLRDEFDCIIFDSPPVLAVTDAALIAPLVDGVIICYEVGKTSRGALLRTKAQLEAVGAKINGIILNHTKPETAPLEPYPYYYRYKNSYYSPEAAEKESGV